jgi:magnesium chelatase family protein
MPACQMPVCRKVANGLFRYQKRSAGPLLEHIDIHANMPRLNYENLSCDRLGESSDTIRGRLEAARERL